MDFNLVIPMAGLGSRFTEAGYKDPKPLIPVNGKPMFVHSVDNIINDLAADSVVGNLIFIISHRMDVAVNLSFWIRHHYKHAKIVTLNEPTDGAACTVRAAAPYLHPEIPVVVANCDQVFELHDAPEYTWSDFMEDYDSGILVFDEPGRDPKWSYVEVDDHNRAVRVAEKQPISDLATVGVYYWGSAALMFTSIGEMIIANDTFNDEFYLCPAFNYIIKSSAVVGTYSIKKMHGLGTPEDLETFLKLHPED